MKKSNLTKDQQAIVDSVIEEFAALNVQKETVNLGVIAKLYEQANSYVNEKNSFYAEIERHNQFHRNQRMSLRDAFLSKLNVLFRAYEVDFKVDETSIRISVKKFNADTKKFEVLNHSGFWLSFNFDSEYASFDSKSSKVSKYTSFSARLNANEIYLDNFEETTQFGDSVVKMFKYILEE